MLRSQSFIYLAFENQAFIVHQLRYWSRGSFFYRRETTLPNYSKDSTNKLKQCHMTRRLQSWDELSGNTLRNRFQYNNSDSIVYIMWNRSGTDICREEKQNSVKNSFISFIVSGLYSYSRYRLELACKWGLCSSSPLPRVRIKPNQLKLQSYYWSTTVEEFPRKYSCGLPIESSRECSQDSLYKAEVPVLINRFRRVSSRVFSCTPQEVIARVHARVFAGLSLWVFLIELSQEAEDFLSTEWRHKSLLLLPRSAESVSFASLVFHRIERA